MVLVAIVGACGGDVVPAVSGVPSGPATADPGLAEAVRFRTVVGLRDDLDWAAAVAGDPRALWHYGFPLLPDEEHELERRASDLSLMAPIIERYGSQNPDTYGGYYLDQGRGQTVIVAFTRNLLTHQLALYAQLPAGTLFQTRTTTISHVDLMALQDRILADAAALRAAGLFAITTSASVQDAQVRVELSSAQPGAIAAFTRRYGPHVSTTVIDPTGAYLLPLGEVRGTVHDQHGRPISASIAMKPLFANIPVDLIAGQADQSGRFRIQQLPGRWRIDVLSAVGRASTDVLIRSGDAVDVTLTME